MVDTVSLRNRLAAQRAGAVRGIDQRGVRQREELAAQRVVEQIAQLRRRPAERGAQIRTADVADEQRVAGEHRVRNVGAHVEVVDEDRHRLGRMPGRVQRHQPDAAHLDRVAVGEEAWMRTPRARRSTGRSSRRPGRAARDGRR